MITLERAQKIAIVLNIFSVVLVLITITGIILLVVDFVFEVPVVLEKLPDKPQKNVSTKTLQSIQYFWTANILPLKPPPEVKKTEPVVVKVEEKKKLPAPPIPYTLVTVCYHNEKIQSFAVVENSRSREQILIRELASLPQTPYKVVSIQENSVIFRFEDYIETLNMTKEETEQTYSTQVTNSINGFSLLNEQIVVTDELLVPVTSLQNGDTIVAINSKTIKDMDSLQQFFARHKGFFEMTIRRDSEEIIIFTTTTGKKQ